MMKPDTSSKPDCERKKSCQNRKEPITCSSKKWKVRESKHNYTIIYHPSDNNKYCQHQKHISHRELKLNIFDIFTPNHGVIRCILFEESSKSFIYGKRRLRFFVWRKRICLFYNFYSCIRSIIYNFLMKNMRDFTRDREVRFFYNRWRTLWCLRYILYWSDICHYLHGRSSFFSREFFRSLLMPKSRKNIEYTSMFFCAYNWCF